MSSRSEWERREFEQHRDGCWSAAHVRDSFEVLDEGRVIAVVSREVREGRDALVVVGVERSRPLEPQLCGARIGQALPVDFTRLHRDIGLALCFWRQLEAALLQIHQQGPILVGHGLASDGLERGEIVGIIRQRSPVEVGGESDVSQRVFREGARGQPARWRGRVREATR